MVSFSDAFEITLSSTIDIRCSPPDELTIRSGHRGRRRVKLAEAAVHSLTAT